MIAIPTMPEALGYMLDPPQGKIRATTLLRKLNTCSLSHGLCQKCRCVDTCVKYYEYIIENDVITNWHGANENVTRYFR
jgi:hypothetical protein